MIKEKVIEYIAYLYLWYKRVDVKFGSCRIIGLPHVRRFPGSKISIESGVTLNSSVFWNPIGLNHQVTLCTLTAQSHIVLKKGC